MPTEEDLKMMDKKDGESLIYRQRQNQDVKKLYAVDEKHDHLLMEHKDGDEAVVRLFLLKTKTRNYAYRASWATQSSFSSPIADFFLKIYKIWVEFQKFC